MKLFLTTLFCWLSLSLYAQTFHLIVVADTEDKRNHTIGPTCEYDLARIKNQVDSMAQQLGYQVKEVIINGDQFGRPALENAINNLICTPNDLIFFYYTGHGFSIPTRTSDFPVLSLNTDSTDLVSVHQQLVAKKPRFCLTLGDCCNNILPNYRNIFANPIFKGLGVTKDKDLLRKLFAESTGDVLISSTKRGEYALGYPGSGSFYSQAWFLALQQACSNNNDLTWETLLADAENRLQGILADFSPNQKHHSHWVINLKPTEVPVVPPIDPVVPNPPPPVGPKPVVTFSDLNAFLNELADESKSYQSNDALRARFRNKYFTGTGQVNIYIRNPEKPVVTQTVDTFLSRMINNGPQIKWVNVVERMSKLGPDGRYTELTVQEVRR